MEQNQNSDQPLIPNESLESMSFPTTLKNEAPQHNSSSSGTLTSGRALRKKYVCALRDEYIQETGNLPGPELMENFKQRAELNFPKDGDYIVRDGVAMYLGIA